jgi:hypothetical protein
MAAMAGTSVREILRIAGLSERSGDRNRRKSSADLRKLVCVWSADKAARIASVSPSRCGKRTPGEQSVFRMMLTRRQIRIAPCGAPPPRMFRGDVLQPLRDYRAETMAHVLFEK